MPSDMLAESRQLLDSADQSDHSFVLFGGQRPWQPNDWTSSDDTVRGGKSKSFLECDGISTIARFHGNLDIKTLGGAGFASQRTTGETRSWDLSGYDGLTIRFAKWDSKRYTITIKDTLLPKRADGRDQTTTSWEYDFQLDSQSKFTDDACREKAHSIFIPWDSLKPTYRGRPDAKAEPLNLKAVTRISILMRSFFGDQEGPFSLSLHSIAATHAPKAPAWSPCEKAAEAGATGNDKQDRDYVSSVRPRQTTSWTEFFRRPGIPRAWVVTALLVGTVCWPVVLWYRS